MMQCSAKYYFSDARSRSDRGMLGGGGMATMYVPGDQWNVASMDESNTFSYVATPRWMWGWCAAPPLRARDLRPVLPSHLQTLPDGAFVWPLYTRLAMGSSHSDHILMDINMTTVGRAMRASSRLRLPPSLAPDPYLSISVSTSHSLQQADATEDFEDVHDYHWEGPDVDPAPDVYDEPLDWDHPAGHRAMNLEQFAAAARAANRDEQQRTFVCMHLFSGRRRRFDLEHHMRLLCEKRGVKPSTFHVLMDLILEGCLDALFAGPPCASWSRLRYRPGGPPPLRARGEQAWGLYDLRGFRLKECQVANALMLNTLALLDALAARGGACGMEHPADPGFDPLPSIWATDVMLGLQERRSFVSGTLDQCACGGPCSKPTMLTGNLQGLAGEGPFCPGVSTAHIHERSVGRTATGGFLSQRLSLYPSGLCEFLAVCFVDSLMLMLADGSGPTGWRRAEAPIPRVSNWLLEPTSTQPQGLAVLNECAARGSRAVVNEARRAFYLHVDDGVFSSTSAEAADALMHEAADALERQGFVVGDRTQASECTKVVGFEVQRSPAMLRLPAAKASLLIRSMLWLASCFIVDTGHVRSILGIWIWGAMLKREALAAGNSIFRFCQHFDGEKAQWWPTARREFRTMAGLVLSLYADVGARIAPYVYATDAQGAGEGDHGGWGIVGTPIPRAFGEFLFSKGTRPGRNAKKLDGTLGAKHASFLVPTIPFTQLPESLFLRRRRWSVLGAGRWCYPDHICLGESRAALKLFVALARRVGAHRSRVLSLQDNMPTSYGWARGRSSAPAINYLLRRRSAHCIGSEIAAILPWVETSRQPADEASRALDGAALAGPASGGQDHRWVTAAVSEGDSALRRVAH